MLVIAAMGGAGLAVAADRPHNLVQRPELTWRADAAAQQHVQAISGELAGTRERVAELSQAGRDVLGRLLTQDQAGLQQALAQGEQAVAEISSDAEALRQLLARTDTEIEPWRLGATTRVTLDELAATSESVAGLPAHWQRLADAARTGGAAAVQSITDGLEAIEMVGGRIDDILDPEGEAE